MRISFILRSLQKGGAGSHQNALSYIRYLRSRGHEVTVYALTSFNDPPEDITLAAYRTEELGLVAGNKFLSALLPTLEQGTDVFFLYGVDCMWGAGLYRKHGGAKPVAVYLDTVLASMDMGERLSTLYYIKRVLWEKFVGLGYAAHVDALVASSPFIKETYVHAGFTESKFSVVSNFFNGTAHSKREYAVPIVRILYAGRLTRDKGIDVLISALQHVSATTPWALRIVGDGPLKEECRRLIGESHLESMVTLLPWASQAELQTMYTSTDLFIHPSRAPEGFGRTFVEVMMHGIPVIASCTGAAPGTLGKAGLFFTPGDAHELGLCMTRLIDDAHMREQLGQLGREHSREFREEVVGPRLEGVLEGLRA